MTVGSPPKGLPRQIGAQDRGGEETQFPKMNTLAGTGEIDEGQKRLNRKEALGTGKMVVWEVGSRVQCLGKCR